MFPWTNKNLNMAQGEGSPRQGHCLYRVLCQSVQPSWVLTEKIKSQSLSRLASLHQCWRSCGSWLQRGMWGQIHLRGFCKLVVLYTFQCGVLPVESGLFCLLKTVLLINCLICLQTQKELTVFVYNIYNSFSKVSFRYHEFLIW